MLPRTLLIVAILLAWQLPASAAQDDYMEQLREYDRRVEEQKALAEQQARRQWTMWALLFSAAVTYLVYSHAVARRRFEAMRANVDRSLAQNGRMIELLESIDRKTGGPGSNS